MVKPRVCGGDVRGGVAAGEEVAGRGVEEEHSGLRGSTCKGPDMGASPACEGQRAGGCRVPPRGGGRGRGWRETKPAGVQVGLLGLSREPCRVLLGLSGERDSAGVWGALAWVRGSEEVGGGVAGEPGLSLEPRPTGQGGVPGA